MIDPNKTPLPASMTTKMSAKDRAKYGRAAWTPQECADLTAKQSEKALQDQIAQYLNMRGIWFDRDAMHKRRFGTVGAPDFQFPFAGFYVAWECKVAAGRLSEEQVGAGVQITSQGGQWHLIRSLEEAKDHLEKLEATAREAGR